MGRIRLRVRTLMIVVRNSDRVGSCATLGKRNTHFRGAKGDFRGAVISRASLGTCKTHFRGAKGDFRGAVISRASLGRVRRTFAEGTVSVLSECSDFR